jgi:hypothetical protein
MQLRGFATATALEAAAWEAATGDHSLLMDLHRLCTGAICDHVAEAPIRLPVQWEVPGMAKSETASESQSCSCREAGSASNARRSDRQLGCVMMSCAGARKFVASDAESWSAARRRSLRPEACGLALAARGTRDWKHFIACGRGASTLRGSGLQRERRLRVFDRCACRCLRFPCQQVWKPGSSALGWLWRLATSLQPRVV